MRSELSCADLFHNGRLTCLRRVHRRDKDARQAGHRERIGPMAPLVESFTVNETGSLLTVSFVHEVENPKISGIEIVPQ